MTSIYDFSAVTIDGKERPLADFTGQVLLIVNTASKCGFTPQFGGLEKLYQEYHDRGLEILGFPCNQFLGQDPGSNSEIGEFCQRNYGVTFPMFEKVEVNGEDTHPLYKFLKEQAPGALGTQAIKWNFTKFLVDREGQVVARFAPKDTPEKIAKAVARLLD
ncbi:MAG: glutathione peroxidase [Pseudomonadota bacterium]|nr:glutathione peroxidase [Pseudomonadota bacterium]